MAPQSSARYVSYELRPSKQCERKLMVEVLSAASVAGLHIGNHRYVGMGANRFYDFIMMHKAFGTNQMISLEHDSKMFERARFNCPYNFIEVLPKSVGEFVQDDDFCQNSVFWLDFDGGIGPHILSDITAFGTKARSGDFLFITVSAGPPKRLEKSNSKERLSELQDTLGDFAGDLTLSDVENSSFSKAVHKVLSATLKFAFSARKDIVFRQSFNVEYADGQPMITVGGLIANPETQAAFQKELSARIPMLLPECRSPFKIRKLDLTEKERGLVDRAVTSRRSNSRDRNQAKLLGFSRRDLDDYASLLRFYPRYVETFM